MAETGSLQGRILGRFFDALAADTKLAAPIQLRLQEMLKASNAPTAREIVTALEETDGSPDQHSAG